MGIDLHLCRSKLVPRYNECRQARLRSVQVNELQLHPETSDSENLFPERYVEASYEIQGTNSGIVFGGDGKVIYRYGRIVRWSTLPDGDKKENDKYDQHQCGDYLGDKMARIMVANEKRTKYHATRRGA